MIKLPKSFSKEDEIQVIIALGTSDTYFADTFDEDDARVMANNIRNDFPLLYNTSVNRDRVKLEKELETMTRQATELAGTKALLEDSMKSLEAENASMRDKLDRVFKELLTNGGDDLNAYEFLSIDQVIRIKLNHGLVLDQREREYLTSILK